jgi:hypothetical protein
MLALVYGNWHTVDFLAYGRIFNVNKNLTSECVYTMTSRTPPQTLPVGGFVLSIHTKNVSVRERLVRTRQDVGRLYVCPRRAFFKKYIVDIYQ